MQAQVRIINVIPELNIKDLQLKKRVLEDEIENRKELWKKFLTHLSLDFPDSSDRLELVIETGNIVEKIKEFVEKEGADLLVLGKKGKRIENGVGSTSKDLIKQIKIPVLLIEKD